MNFAARWMLMCMTLVLTVGTAWGQDPAPKSADTDTAVAAAAGAAAAVKQQQRPLLERLNLDDFWAETTVREWLLLLGLLFVGVVAGRIISAFLKRVASRLESRGWPARAEIFGGMAGPANLALTTVGIAAGLFQMHTVVGELAEFVLKAVQFLYAVAAVWFLSNLVDVVEVALLRYTSRHTDAPLDRQLVPIVTKTLRLFVLVLGVLFVAQTIFGADIGAWLAGLGIAGLAVSLAAQDTLKNLFGSLTLLLDKPLKVGERVILKGFDGTVEEINLRSIRLRTNIGHLVTIPNQIVVNDVIENPARRPYIRRLFNVTITYDTPLPKVREAVEIIRRIYQEPGIREPIHGSYNGGEMPPRAFFNDLNADSLNIQVLYWHFPPDWWAYMDHAMRFNLRLMEEYEKAGIEFAFPTRTLYLAGDAKRQLTMKMLSADLDEEGGAKG